MGAEKINVFLVDDDPFYLKSLENLFKSIQEFNVHVFNSGNECLNNLHKGPDIVVLDYALNGLDATSSNGLTTLRKIKEQKPNVHVIMLSSQDKIEVAVNCMKHQASDYIVKNETAFVRLKIAIKNIFIQNKTNKTVQKWDW